MGHVPISGPGGSLPVLAELRAAKPSESSGRIVYIHMNNTNPILDATSPEASLVQRAGIEIAMDGMAFAL
jgi:pyrroloquinoline quinone biosynthesis protein B